MPTHRIPEDLWEFQKEDALRMASNGNVLHTGEMGTGKAQPLDSQLLTPDGWIKMGDIQVDDLVYGSDGLPHRVTGVHPQEKQTIYEVTFTDGSSTKCTIEHLWEVNTPIRKWKNRPSRVMSLLQIAKQGLKMGTTNNTRFFIPITAPIQFPQRDLPLHPYLLGILLGDGNLSKDKSTPRITNIDTELIAKVAKLLPDKVKLRYKADYTYTMTTGGGTPFHYRKNYNPVKKALREMNLCVTSDKKFIPTIYKFSSITQRQELLQGLMDSDGYIQKNGVNIVFTSTSEALCDGVKFVVESLGGVTKKTTKETTTFTYRGEKKNGKTAYNLHLNIPFNPFTLTKRKERFVPRRKYHPARGIVKVTSLRQAPCKCIRVESEDGLYITDNCILTHNTPTTISALEMGGSQRILIVCKDTFRLEWANEIRDWRPSAHPTLPEGEVAVSQAGRDKLKPFTRGKARYHIVNYEALRIPRHLEELQSMEFDAVVFDEVHKLKNPRAKLTRGAWRFVESQPRAKIIGLTGSPIINYPDDLYVPLSLCWPEDYPHSIKRWQYFTYNYCLWSDSKFGPYIYGIRNASALQAEVDKLNIIRRTKAECMPWLPEKYYRRVLLEMKPAQRKVYRQMEKEFFIMLEEGMPLWAPHALANITRLRQINLHPLLVGVDAPSAKTEFLQEFVRDTCGSQKLVVFSCFERYINILSQAFSDIPHIVLTGKVKATQQSADIKRFQEDGRVRLCLGTIQSAGESHTLTAASNVVLADRWWNEPRNEQAVDRLHRGLQKSAVQAIYPIVLDSVDASLDKILKRKNHASRQFYGEPAIRRLVIEDRTKGKTERSNHGTEE